jgi:hypothetical protein
MSVIARIQVPEESHLEHRAPFGRSLIEVLDQALGCSWSLKNLTFDVRAAIS